MGEGKGEDDKCLRGEQGPDVPSPVLPAVQIVAVVLRTTTVVPVAAVSVLAAVREEDKAALLSVIVPAMIQPWRRSM